MQTFLATPVRARRSSSFMFSFMLCAAFVPVAQAHTVGLSRGTWLQEGEVISAELVFHRGELQPPTADPITQMKVTAGGAPCPGKGSDADLVEEDGLAIRDSFVCPSRSDVRVDLQPLLAALPNGHRHLAHLFEPSGAAREIVLDLDNPSFRFEPGLSGDGAPHAVSAYVKIGVEHILFGFDHLVFLLGLVLGIRLVPLDLRAILATVTAFTVAHSLTLALSVLEVATAPGDVIEPLIALSVVYVGLENFIRRAKPDGTSRTRWPLAALFGLVHGFGFAGALGEVGLPQASVPLALFCFNVGVELGQIAVLTVVLPALVFALRWPFVRAHGPRALSVAVTVLGAFWLVERLLSR